MVRRESSRCRVRCQPQAAIVTSHSPSKSYVGDTSFERALQLIHQSQPKRGQGKGLLS